MGCSFSNKIVKISDLLLEGADFLGGALIGVLGMLGNAPKLKIDRLSLVEHFCGFIHKAWKIADLGF